MNVNSKAQVIAAVEKHAPQIMELAKQIGEHPELGFKEYQAAGWLCGALTAAGFEVHRGVAGMDTAFRAELGEGEPQIALLCEYDALPEIGHACGHNLIGTASVGAAVALAEFMGQLQGQAGGLGRSRGRDGRRQGEAGGGGAVSVHRCRDDVSSLVEEFAHEYKQRAGCLRVCVSRQGSSRRRLTRGRDQRLDGVIQLFNGINALREHLKDDVRIHGIISEGGTAANIVPERAAARFYFRASTRAYLDEVAAKIFKIAEGAALMTGTTVQWDKYELSNDNFVPQPRAGSGFWSELGAVRSN